MDHVYVVRPGDANEELRYSLRSLEAHVDHDRVWVVGHCPAWLDIDRLPVAQTGTKYVASTRNVDAALRCGEISDPFVLWNDDMFAMAPTDIPTVHRGPVGQVIADYIDRCGENVYVAGMVHTAAVLRSAGFLDPISYELHVPLVVHKAAMRAALTMGAGVPVWHKRTAYGNIAGLGGAQMADVKVCHAHPAWSRDQVWISTDDAAFEIGDVGRYIRSQLTAPSRWER